jgi:hypothetical protein
LLVDIAAAKDNANTKPEMAAGGAEETAQKLDDLCLWALKSMELERDTKPFAMRFRCFA